ncbi:unnamed protein product [Symbiodinium natans]|uniref:Uncharacterized protein n=1 Tax=Symbiodinium natans TaxID=878477 RepID=A0A812PRN1_9DINO|nr:unnamed protein product [Symbiodinium natans]
MARIALRVSGSLCCLLGLGFLGFAIYLQAVPCPLKTCFVVDGKTSFSYTHSYGESGNGGPEWYAPAGTSPAVFAQQLTFQNLTELGPHEHCGFIQRHGQQRFGLAHVGSFSCTCAEPCDAPPSSGYYIPPHRFVSSIPSWIWDSEREYMTHYVDAFLPFLTVVAVAGGLLLLILGACLLFCAWKHRAVGKLNAGSGCHVYQGQGEAGTRQSEHSSEA